MSLEYICSQLVRMLHCNICLIDENKEILQTYGSVLQKENPFYTDADLRRTVSDRSIKDIPDIFCENHSILYGIISLEKKKIVIGPICIERPTRELKKYMIQKHQMDTDIKEPIVYCSMKTFGSAVLMLYHVLTGKEISLDELWRANALESDEISETKESVSQTIFQHQEGELPHNPYDQEKRELDSIRKGDREMLSQSLQETYQGEVGRLSKDDLRQAKNIAICVIVLASRAAIEGGMLPEEAFSMVDAYILKVEEMNNIIKVDAMMRQAEYDFTDHVHSIHRSKKKNEIIERTKNYIFQHLHNKIIIGEIGHEMGVSTTYLSELFHKIEGVTIQRYIRREKIRLAENLLRYSEYTVQEIALYLSFCSQSHFGQIFKDEVGMTPSKYREKFGVLQK